MTLAEAKKEKFMLFEGLGEEGGSNEEEEPIEPLPDDGLSHR